MLTFCGPQRLPTTCTRWPRTRSSCGMARSSPSHSPARLRPRAQIHLHSGVRHDLDRGQAMSRVRVIAREIALRGIWVIFMTEVLDGLATFLLPFLPNIAAFVLVTFSPLRRLRQPLKFFVSGFASGVIAALLSARHLQ